jgi:hypothetical protein
MMKKLRSFHTESVKRTVPKEMRRIARARARGETRSSGEEGAAGMAGT